MKKLTSSIVLIASPIIALFIILFLRVAVGLVTSYNVESGAGGGTGERILIGLLNFAAFIAVIAIPVCVIIGVLQIAKAEKTQPMVITGNIAMAGRGKRFFARLIDGAIVFVGLLILSVIFGKEYPTPEEEQFLGSLIILFVIAIMCVQFFFLSRDGQSIGKKILKIKIVDSETHVTGGFYQNVAIRAIVNGLLGMIPLYSLVDAVFIFNDDRRCIHDKMAGTIVVDAKEAVKHVTEQSHSQDALFRKLTK